MSTNTTTASFVTINVPLVVSAADLWSETFGSGWEYSDVAIRVVYQGEANWETPGVATVFIENPEGEGMTSMDIRVEILAEAYGKLIAMGYTHCGAPIALGNFDACASFDILQMAVFSELVFG